MKAQKTVSLVVFTLSLLMLGIAACKHNSQDAQVRSTSKQTLASVTTPGSLPITISSTVPTELNPGTGTGFGAPAASHAAGRRLCVAGVHRTQLARRRADRRPQYARHPE